MSLNVDMLVTEGTGVDDSRADFGDSKNWAGQVGERRNELTSRPCSTKNWAWSASAHR